MEISEIIKIAAHLMIYLAFFAILALAITAIFLKDKKGPTKKPEIKKEQHTETKID
ncbi:MAG: hypothetical protein WEB89_01325 [Balneolales bacterium]